MGDAPSTVLARRYAKDEGTEAATESPRPDSTRRCFDRARFLGGHDSAMPPCLTLAAHSSSGPGWVRLYGTSSIRLRVGSVGWYAGN